MSNGIPPHMGTPSPTPEEQHRANERAYWERQIRVARWLNWITAGAVIVGAVSLIFLAISLHDTKITAEAARTQAVAARDANRAWVKQDAAIGSDLVFSEREGRISILFQLNNVGHSPALNVYVFHYIYLETRDRQPIEEQKWFCDLKRNRPEKESHLGRVMFPGDSKIETDSDPINIDRIDDAMALGGGHFLNVIVIGCVDYRFPFEKEHHQTRFIYRVVKVRNINRESGIGIVPSEKNIPLNDIALEQYYFGYGADAD